MLKPIKVGRLKPRDANARRISAADLADAREWTQKLSIAGKAPTADGGRVTMPPKRARLFWV